MKLESLIDASKGSLPKPMSEEESRAYITMNFIELQKPDFASPIDDKSPPILQIMQDRLLFAGISDKVSFPVKLFLCSLCDRPAKAVMWAYTLAHMLELGDVKISFQVLSKHFPVGFPTEEVQEACWVAQKGHAHGVKADNLMDYKEWWQ